MLTILPESTDTLLALRVSGKLSEEDLRRLDSEFHRRKQIPGPSHMVMILDDFNGYESLRALWTDSKMDIAHKDDFQKVAIVGKSSWKSGFSKIADLMTKGELKWFSIDDKLAAIDWAGTS